MAEIGLVPSMSSPSAFWYVFLYWSLENQIIFPDLFYGASTGRCTLARLEFGTEWRGGGGRIVGNQVC